MDFLFTCNIFHPCHQIFAFILKKIHVILKFFDLSLLLNSYQTPYGLSNQKNKNFLWSNCVLKTMRYSYRLSMSTSSTWRINVIMMYIQVPLCVSQPNNTRFHVIMNQILFSSTHWFLLNRYMTNNIWIKTNKRLFVQQCFFIYSLVSVTIIQSLKHKEITNWLSD